MRPRYGVRPRPYGLHPFIVWDFDGGFRVEGFSSHEAAKTECARLNGARS